MGDARTKLDILYQDVLGDVSDLVSRIERLDDGFPDLAEKINAAAARLESASGVIQERLQQLATDEAKKAISEVRQGLNDERIRQEVELQKFVNLQFGKLGEAAYKAVQPASDKLLSVALDAMRERENLVKKQAENPGLVEQLMKPLLYVAMGAAIAVITVWALNITIVSIQPKPSINQSQ